MARPHLRSATILVAAVVVGATTGLARRYLVIAPGTAGEHGTPVQVQAQ